MSSKATCENDERMRVWWLECVRMIKDMSGLNIHSHDEPRFFSQTLRFHRFLVPLVYDQYMRSSPTKWWYSINLQASPLAANSHDSNWSKVGGGVGRPDGIGHPLAESDHSESITPHVGVSHPPQPHWGRGTFGATDSGDWLCLCPWSRWRW